MTCCNKDGHRIEVSYCRSRKAAEFGEEFEFAQGFEPEPELEQAELGLNMRLELELDERTLYEYGLASH